MKEFDEVYRTHAPAVYRFALRAVSDRALAEDLTAEAFLELHRHWTDIDVERLPGWLLTVVRNRARDHWRRLAVETRHAATAVPIETSAHPTDAASLERWLLECVDLKPGHRTCLMLRYVHGMTRGEIASTTGLNEMQVKSCLQYGLELLRKTLTKGAPA